MQKSELSIFLAQNYKQRIQQVVILAKIPKVGTQDHNTTTKKSPQSKQSQEKDNPLFSVGCTLPTKSIKLHVAYHPSRNKIKRKNRTKTNLKMYIQLDTKRLKG
jgi:hypothetical protein